jgi:hypothetical protein
MSLDSLIQEVTSLPPEDQRRLTAYLVSLQDSRDALYRQKLAQKIDRPASEFATLEDLDERLKLSDDERP